MNRVTQTSGATKEHKDRTAHKHIRCVACSSTDVSAWCQKRNDYGEFEIMLCKKCRTSFVWPEPRGDLLAQFYASLSPSTATYQDLLEAEHTYPNATVDARRIAQRCKDRCSGNRLLDIGAGHGFFSRAALDLGFTVTACEPSPDRREVYREMNGFDPQGHAFDDRFAQAHRGSFDAVLLIQVLEHLPHPAAVLRNIGNVLSADGIAVIAVPHFGSAVSRVQGKNDMFIIPPEHLNYFSKNGLVDLCERSGFTIAHLETLSRFDPARVSHRLPVPLGSRALASGLQSVLRAFDVFGMGMFLNVYIKKRPEKVGTAHANDIRRNHADASKGSHVEQVATGSTLLAVKS